MNLTEAFLNSLLEVFMEPHSYLSPVNRLALTLTRLIYSCWQILVRPQPETGPHSARLPV